MNTRYFLVSANGVYHVAVWHSKTAAYVPELTTIGAPFEDADQAAREVARLNRGSRPASFHCPYIEGLGETPIGGNAYRMEDA